MSPFEQSMVFTKMHVSGNDFCLINGLHRRYSFNPDEIRRLGDRRTGVGFDQLILIESLLDTKGDVAVEFFNSDGSKTDQCGNGCAAAVAYLQKHRLVRKTIVRLESSHQITECAIVDSDKQNCYTVDVSLGIPRLNPADVPFLAEKQQTQYELDVPSQNKPILISVVSLGNPHAVIVVPDVDQVALDQLGTEIQQHESFPQSTNVEVLEIQDGSNGRLRIFERGVGETRACGTGAAAAMIAGRLLQSFTSSVHMKMRGGSTLIRWKGMENPVIVRCKPLFTFTGTVPISSFS
ncbi:MAG: diaminopimelate epimerase [Gammaproteobacteria bacterium]|nr:diaminopimelate epimerase [Gammaproteobacteria bacterium]MYF37275.1 diaminopimelate epimerase [Gammaproteobacteria bacterium]